jgi:hypothetical protein
MPLLDKLLDEGFQLVTRWKLDGRRIKPASLYWDECGGWLYAFVIDGAVKYIGLTTGVLRTRLDQYRAGKEAYGQQTQCGRIKAMICEQLLDGKAVEIYGLRKPFSRKETLAAEEGRLIAAYRSPSLWNRT